MRRAFFASALIAACAHGGTGSRYFDDGAGPGAGGTSASSNASSASGSKCAAGESSCGGKCVDLQTNPANCGSCAKPCGASEDCVKGQCLPQTPDAPASGTSSSTTANASSAQSSSQSASSQASSSASSAKASSAVASSSSSGGGTCDPMFPKVGCGAGKHCLPSQNGMTTCKGPTGAGKQYSSCVNSDSCAPELECTQTPYKTVYCLEWCQSDLDCSGFDACTYFKPAVYAGGFQYGVCWDGFP